MNALDSSLRHRLGRRLARSTAVVALGATTALTAAAVLLAAPGASAASSADAATYNPWGHENGDVLTEAEASAVLLHQVNLQRAEASLPPLAESADRSGAQCSTDRLASTHDFKHYDECLPTNHYENIYASYSSGAAVVEAAGPWTRSTSGHNEALYSPVTTHAQVSISCTSSNKWASEGYVAFQPTNADGRTTLRPARANVRQLDQADSLYRATGVACDGSSLRFRLAPELRGLAAQTVEPAIDSSTPQTWYRFQVARLYSAYFDRAPDADGWAYWNQRSIDGMTLWRASDFFADSDEFRRIYGNSIDDAAFLDLVYRNVLDRAPDDGGFRYWLDRMDNGTTRGQVMVFFSESPEYIEQVGPEITGTCWNGDVMAAYECAADDTTAPSGR